MKSITVAELRQNPTEALNAVEAGETYSVTRHRRVIARLAPPNTVEGPRISPPRKSGSANLSSRPRRSDRSMESVDRLIEDMKSEW